MKIGAKMYEYQSSPEDQAKVEAMTQPAEPVELPREMLEARIQELTKSVEYKDEEMLRYKKAWDELRYKVDRAEEAFKEILAGDIEAKDIIETYGEVLAEHLGWEFNNEVEIEIQVTWRGTINLPYGVEVSDLDIDDFGLNEPCHNEYDTNFWNGINDYSIDER